MTDYTVLSDSTIDSDSILTQSTAFAWRDNPIAITEGAPGAPQVQTAGIADNAITAAKIASNTIGQGDIGSGAIHQSELDTSTGTVSRDSLSLGDLTLPGGSYGFYPQIESDNTGTEVVAQIAVDRISTSWVTNIALARKSGDGVSARQRYINSSPPIDLGDGDVPLFFFAEIDATGKIVSTYAADVPPWLYNGPTNAQPSIVSKVKDDQNRLTLKKMRIQRMIDPVTKRVSDPVAVEVTNDLKNADMGIIPHPFPGAPNDSTIILLDPPETEELLYLHQAGEEIHKLFRDDYLRLDNAPLNRACPVGVVPTRFKWTNTQR